MAGWDKKRSFRLKSTLLDAARGENIGFNDVFLHIWKGSSPELWTSDIEWTTIYGSFLRRYIQNLTDLSSEQDFLNFMRLVAARIGHQLNFRDLTVLEKTALVYLLPEHSENGRNRKLQSHKVYFTDTGLCAFLSGWPTKKALMDGAMNDLMLENFVIIEILKSYRNRSVEPQLYYLRDSDGKEIDLLIEENEKIYPIEIKKTASPNPSMVKNFEVIPEEIRGNGALVCFVQDDFPLNGEASTIPISYL